MIEAKAITYLFCKIYTGYIRRLTGHSSLHIQGCDRLSNSTRRYRRMTRPLSLAVLLLPAALLFSPVAANAQTKHIMIGSQLQKGFDMGVNSSESRTDWLTNAGGYFHMAYPSGQSWGAVFVTVGKPKNPPRPFQDFSAYKELAIDLKGGSGAEVVYVGIKTNTQADDGTEAKVAVKLTRNWRTYHFPLKSFIGTDTKRLYVVTEFVFEGSAPRSVSFRNISFGK